MADAGGGQQHELSIVRTLNAPPGMVWKAFTERDWLLRWHCRKGFKVIHAEMDARVGGSWRIGVRSAAKEYFMRGTVTDIEAPSRLVQTHQWESEGDQEVHAPTIMTVKLTGQGDSTQLAFRQQNLPSEEWKRQSAKAWNEAFDNLSACLANEVGD